MPSPKAWISSTKLIVGDLDRSAAFYQTTLGLTATARIKGVHNDGRAFEEIMYARTPEGGISFVLFHYPAAPKPVTNEVILVVTTEDLAAFMEQWFTAGGTLELPVKDMPEHGVKVVFLRDNEGHIVEVIERL
jgi:lactoylglutathione lyase